MGPALGRGGWGKGATPQAMAGPRGRDRHATPPSAVTRLRQGTRWPPPLPPPSHSGPRADGGRPKKRRPRTPSEEAPASGVRGHHGRGRSPHALPAAGRRRTGSAQDGANGAALSEAGPGKTGARTRAGGFPPPPPAALTHWRLTRPRQTPAAARQPPRHEYTPGGHAGDNRWQADARRGGGRPPPRSPPPAWEPQERPSAPPEPSGRAPPPPEGTATRGGGGGDAAGPAPAPQRPQLPAPAGVAAAGRAQAGVLEQRAHQAWGRRTAAHQNSMEAAPHMTLP